MSSLLHDVLRPNLVSPEQVAARLDGISLRATKIEETPTSQPTTPPSGEDEDIVGVQSVPLTPRTASRVTSRPSSRPGSRSHSPSRLGGVGAASRRVPGPLHITAALTQRARDPLRLLPTEISQRIFSQLSVKQLARCARVSRKWNRSQTLNHVWFQLYRKENFQDESLPPGKWTRRESKQDWRNTYIQYGRRQDRDSFRSARLDADSSLLSSGYQTPREIREERWRSEAEVSKPGKVEMREAYKELGGRKAKTKGKFGAVTRDKGGWDHGEDGY